MKKIRKQSQLEASHPQTESIQLIEDLVLKNVTGGDDTTDDSPDQTGGSCGCGCGSVLIS